MSSAEQRLLSNEDIDAYKAKMTNAAYFSKDEETRQLGQIGLRLVADLETLRSRVMQARLSLEGRMHVGQTPPRRAFHT